MNTVHLAEKLMLLACVKDTKEHVLSAIGAIAENRQGSGDINTVLQWLSIVGPKPSGFIPPAIHSLIYEVSELAIGYVPINVTALRQLADVVRHPMVLSFLNPSQQDGDASTRVLLRNAITVILNNAGLVR